MAKIFTGKVFLLVTGASRGIGRKIAETFGPLLEKNSKILLLARNEESLRKIANQMPSNLTATYKSVDLSGITAHQLNEILLESLKQEKPESFDQAIIVHCAAMANFDQLTTDMTNFVEWQKCFNLNVFSPAVINGLFMKLFNYQKTKKFVINISSYWGIKPDVYIGSYCSAKAAKDMFFKVFALENPDVSVLNYLPGYVETDMFYDILKKSKNEKLKNEIKDLVESRSYVTPEQTIEYLIETLKKQNYKSGDYVDYYKRDC